MTLTPTDIEKLREKYADITERGSMNNIDGSLTPAGMRFIVAAHNLMPALLAAAEEAQRLRERLARMSNELMLADGENAVNASARATAFECGRRAGIEQAAKLCDRDEYIYGREYATAIRALADEKEKGNG